MRCEHRSNAPYQQLLRLVSIMQELWIIEEKWRFVESIRHLRQHNKKVGWRCALYKKSIQIVSQQGIKCPDTMVDLLWANAYISGYVMHNSLGTVIRSTPVLWWLLFARAWSLLVVRLIACCSCPEPSCLSVERLSFSDAWVITALWPKCSCCLVFSYVPCVVWTGCFCRTTIVMTIFFFLVCWNSVL